MKTKFSILTDESTDIGTVKTSCIVVRLYDELTKHVESKFWELLDVFDIPTDKQPEATAEHLFNCLIETLNRYKIPLDNIIGFGSDGCNVMMGSKNSSKRQSTLKQFQLFIDLKPKKILHPSQTRWLSLEAVVNKILEQWETLRLYITWILPKFNEFNKYFQTQKVVINDLHDKIRILYQEILLSFLKRNYVVQNDLSSVRPDDGEHHLPDNQLYLGAQVLKYINLPGLANKNEEKKNFFKSCRHFLQTAKETI
ncbi:uncharacterized protein LOC111029028 [Myzus persicae]|uniref:uncharacterized protein LOC111029028 n=1 Tax=Myzus persicae TaxID=13164 RepID=UPI000B938F4C|nr:uncharacterized protein LOC111029028 [Myzus persicae]